jgi:CubicO group peptidase (beta-lactamase class C family)
MAWPSASLRYSAADLLRYAAWQMAERDASVKLAHRPTWYTPDRQTWVAFNWIGTQTPHGRLLRYSGATWGFTSVVEIYPDAELAVVLLSNKAAEGAQATLRALSAKLVEVFRPEAGLTSPTPAGVQPPAR